MAFYKWQREFSIIEENLKKEPEVTLPERDGRKYASTSIDFEKPYRKVYFILQRMTPRLESILEEMNRDRRLTGSYARDTNPELTQLYSNIYSLSVEIEVALGRIEAEEERARRKRNPNLCKYDSG